MKLKSLALQSQLNIGKDNLAYLLGVTEQELTNWEEVDSGYPNTSKSGRLSLLLDIVEFMANNYPQIESSSYLSILTTERITFDLDDTENGSCALIGFLNANPHKLYWRLIIAQILEEHLKL